MIVPPPLLPFGDQHPSLPHERRLCYLHRVPPPSGSCVDMSPVTAGAASRGGAFFSIEICRPFSTAMSRLCFESRTRSVARLTAHARGLAQNLGRRDACALAAWVLIHDWFCRRSRERIFHSGAPPPVATNALRVLENSSVKFENLPSMWALCSWRVPNRLFPMPSPHSCSKAEETLPTLSDLSRPNTCGM